MYPNQPPSQPPHIDNNMTMSIVSLLLFWPLAIPAIINASKVNSLLAVGDYAGAQHASTESKKWSKWAIIVGVIVLSLSLICSLIACIIGVGASTTSPGY